jgi:predicted amidohydrolase YtcJ
LPVKMRWITLLCLIALAMTSGCRKDADLLLFNGSIYTVNDHSDIVSALVISGGHVIATGREADLRKEYKARRETDLKGQPVFPGFIDPHCHFYSYGLTLRQADLTGTASTREIAERLVQHASLNPGKWVLGRGWDQNDWQNKKFPHKELLDSLFPDIPVYLVRIDGHAAWVNSKAIALAGINKDTRVEGGEIISDQHGLTGILVDNAMVLVEKLIPAATKDEKIRALLKAQSNCFAVGLTSVGDAGLDRETVELVDSLQKKDSLHMHINAMLNPTKENIDFYIDKGVYKTDRLTVRSIKLYADGALGSRGALLKKPYTDDPSAIGLQVSGTKYLEEICRLAYAKGYQVNIHCIGDSAVSLVLSVYSSILPEHNDLRWRIEHAQVVDPADLERFKKYAVIPSVQTTHATSDMYWAKDRLGPVRVTHAYAYRSLLEQNGWMPNGSDFPVESINPVYGFYAAVARKDLQGMPAGGYYKDQALTREQALRAMTIWAAKASFDEKERGSLEPGKNADFVILDRDIMKVSEDSIPGTRVLETWVSGRAQR